MASTEKLTDAELLGLISLTTGGIQNQGSQHITTDLEKVHESTCSNVENHENSSPLSLETKVSSVLGGTFIHSDSSQSDIILAANDLNTEKPDSNLFASTTQSESDISSSNAFTVQTANQSDSNIVHPTVTQSVSQSSESSLVNSMSQSDVKLHIKDDMPSNVKSSSMSNLNSSLSAINSSSSNTESSSYVKISSTCELKSSSSSSSKIELEPESPSIAQCEIPSSSGSQLNTCSNNVSKTMDKKSDCTNLSKEEAIKLVHECRTELEATKKKLQRSERQLTKANDYNEVLRSMVEKLSSEIHRVKTVQTCSVHVQVDKEDFLNYTTGVDTMPKWIADDESIKMSVETSETPDVVIVTPEIPSTLQTGSETEAISIADSIKQAAEAVVQQQQANMLQDQGYVYDDHSGLYYHPASGYYYDQHKSLFYDPKTGIYYYYDYDTGEYLFHSQVEIPAQSQTTEQPNFMDHDQSKKYLSKVRKSRNTARKKRDNVRHSADDKVFKNRKERRQAEKENQLRNRSQHRRDSYHKKRERKRKYTDIVDSGESGNDRRRRSGEEGYRSERKSKRGYRSYDRNERRGKRRSRSRSKRRHGEREYEKELKEMHSDINDIEVIGNEHGERTKVKKRNEREKHTEPSAKRTKPKSIESTESKDCKLSSNDEVDDGDEDLIANSAEEFDLDSENEFIVIDDADDVIEIDGEEHVDDDNMNDANESDNLKDSAVNNNFKDDHQLNSMESYSRKSHEKKSERRYHHRERRSESSRSYHSHSDGSENEAESGELTDSDIEQSSESYSSYYSDTEEDMYEDMDGNESYEEEQEVAGSYPPCIRMMVLESDYLPVGTLHIVTCTGAKLGRENCDICIPDLNVSKVHSEIQYNEGASQYEIYDHASQNGTFLNDQRLSPAKIASERFVLSHDDYVVISSTKLLCHIHSGSDTCDQCEPGVVIATHKAQLPQNEIKVLSKEERLRQKKQELNQIKKRYGLKNSAYENNVEVFNNPNYTDKAEERRKFVGSDVPGQKQEAPASVHRPISTGNVGHKMLQKMGWKEGDSLGKNNKGIQEPISVTLRASQKAGLGSASAGAFTADDANTVDMRKASRRLQAQQRFKQIEGNSEQNQTNKIKSWTKGDTEFT